MSTSNKKLIVVLHMIRSQPSSAMKHTLEQCRIAVENNTDGVSVIAHSGSLTKQDLIDTAAEIKKRHPHLLVTINFLGEADEDMNQVPEFADGIWTDFGVDSRGYQSCVLKAAAVRQTAKSDWSGLWFAGFFHKGGRRGNVEDHVLQTLTDQCLALHSSVVPTFTGPGTGQSADTALLTRIHRAIAGRKPMAIASGITVQNVAD
jgi:predicted TIM-barrel enzyme